MTHGVSYSSSFGGYGNYPGQGEMGHNGAIQIKGSGVNYNKGELVINLKKKAGPNIANQNQKQVPGAGSGHMSSFSGKQQQSPQER